jgi:hypothetical protein
MNRLSAALRGLVGTGLITIAAACSGDLTTPTDGSTGTIAEAGSVSALAGSLRVRCERRSGRSKVSVDGNNLSPRNGTFSARVRAAGGTAISAARRAVGDEAEFDFDSNRNDIAAGATRISPTFIARQAGPDVVGEMLDSRGGVVASQGVECSIR